MGSNPTWDSDSTPGSAPGGSRRPRSRANRRKNLRHLPLPKIENRRQLPPDPERMHRITGRTPPDFIGHEVRHPHPEAVRQGPKMVFMMPEPAGPDPLFIDEVFAFTHVGDLRQPPRGHTGQNPDPVLDQLPRKHPGSDVSNDPEGERRRSERVQVMRRGKEIPDRAGMAGGNLLAIKTMDHRANGCTRRLSASRERQVFPRAPLPTFQP